MSGDKPDSAFLPPRPSIVGNRATRRGFAVATVVILLLMLNLLAFGAIRGGSDESSVASLRVETLRALYACDAGLVIALGELSRGADAASLPSSLSFSGASVDVQASDEDGGIQVVIEGWSGFGRRRVLVEAQGSD